jgi:uncharacterized iron-regulated protein
MSLPVRWPAVVFLLVWSQAVSSVGGTPRTGNSNPDLEVVSGIGDLVRRLAGERVVFIGETHHRYDHHLNQLRIIRRLHANHADLAIGMGFFELPFQQVLDDYVAGAIGEKELLKRTKYFQRWDYDFRLYAPILRFARKMRIPVVALRLPEEITRQVMHGGLESLSGEHRARIPSSIDRTDESYRKRLKAFYEIHPRRMQADFGRFLEVQLLWDEAMAERAADYLKRYPTRRLVVLAGSRHLAYGSGIPRRLARRLEVASAIVLQGSESSSDSHMGDYLLPTEKRTLPPAGRLGIRLGNFGDGVVVVAFSRASAAAASGIMYADRIVSVDGEPVSGVADVKVALWDKRPGDRVVLKVRRRFWFPRDAELDFVVELGGY